MAVIIGSCLVFWVLYATIAYFSKHENGLWITGCLGVIAGFGAMAARNDYNTLIASIISIFAIIYIKSIQINSPEKLEAKRKAQQEIKKQNNISSSQATNKKIDVFDNIRLSIDESNKVTLNKYLSEEEKQKLFKIKEEFLNRDDKRLESLVESYKEVAYIEPTKKKKLEEMFLRSFNNVFKIKDIIIDGKKTKLYYFNPESIFSNVGAFWCLLEIGVRNPRYFALEFSYDCSFVVTEWSFTDDGRHKHSTYTTLVDGIQDFVNHGTKMPLTDEFIEEVKRIIKNKGGQDNE